jgi:hypothetical protein
MKLRPAFVKFRAARAASLVATGMSADEAIACSFAEATGRQRYGDAVGDAVALDAELVKFEKPCGEIAWGIMLPIPPAKQLFSTFDTD